MNIGKNFNTIDKHRLKKRLMSAVSVEHYRPIFHKYGAKKKTPGYYWNIFHLTAKFQISCCESVTRFQGISSKIVSTIALCIINFSRL